MKVASISERYLCKIVELKRDVRTRGGAEFKAGRRFYVVDARRERYTLRTHDEFEEKLIVRKQSDIKIMKDAR